MSDNRINVYDLLYLARSGEDEAFGLLIEQFKPLFYRNYKGLKDQYERVDRDDVYDAMLTGLYNAVTHYREDKNTAFTSFATLCITREMRNYYRSTVQKLGMIYVPLDSYMNEAENLRYGDKVLRDEGSDPQSIVRLKMLIEEIDRVLGDSLEKKVFHMRVDGYSYVDIADALGIRKKDVDNSLQRIRKKIAYLFD